MRTRVPSVEGTQTCFTSKRSLRTGADDRHHAVRAPVATS